MKTQLIIIPLLIIFGFSTLVLAGNYEIKSLKPIFNKATPGFGDFTIQTCIKSNINEKSELSVICLYIGLTHPGVNYNDEPQIVKQYKQVKIEPLKEVVVTFDKGFRSFNPDTRGELIISIVGMGIVRSFPLKTNFHPESLSD